MLLCVLALAPAWALAAGDLDPTFAAGAGYQLVPLGDTGGERGWLSSVRIDAAGRLVAAGHSDDASGDFDFRLARLDADGELDASFGSGGLVRVDVGATSNLAGSLLIDGNGRYLVCGSADAVAPSTVNRVAVVRVNGNGSLDTSFDLDGRVLLQLVHPADGVPSSAAVAGCAADPAGGLFVFGALFRAGNAEASALLLRLHADGSVDTAFGDGGMLVFDVGDGSPQLSAVSNAIVQADGAIIASGFANVAPDTVQYDVFATRVLAGGSFDPGYGDAGVRMIAFDQGGGDVDVASGLVATADGGVVISAVLYTDTDGYDIGLARLDAAGTPGAAFGTGGRVRIGFNGGGANNDESRGIAMDDMGRIYVAGVVDVAVGNTDAFVARVDATGSLDTSYADGGWLVLGVDAPLASPLEFVSSLRLDSQQRVVAVGGGPNTTGLVLRLTADSIFADGFEARP